MSNNNVPPSFYNYVHSTYTALENRIQYVAEHYEPTNFSISGNLTVGGNTVTNGNTTLGSNSSDAITVNGTSTFNGETTFDGNVNANNVQIRTLTVLNNTIIGENNEDDLTVNSNTTFASNVTFNQTLTANGNSFFGNLTVSGNLDATGNVTLGSNSSDLITVNGETTFIGDVNANVAQIRTLTILDNTVIGEDNYDDLTVNSNTVFQGDAAFNQAFNVNGNAVFGTDTTNTVTSTGTITAPHHTIPLTSGNSFKTGSNDTIVYIEYADDIDINTAHPRSVILTVKNTHTANISIYTGSTYYIHTPNSTGIYLKTSTSSYVLVGSQGSVFID